MKDCFTLTTEANEFSYLADLLEDVCIAAIDAIYEYQKRNSPPYIPTYYEYPENFFKGIEANSDYIEAKKTLPVLKHNFPYYILSRFNTPPNYGELLRGTKGPYNIDCNTLPGFSKLLHSFTDNAPVHKVVTNNKGDIENLVISLLRNTVNRYLYVTKKFQSGDIDNILLHSLIEKQLNRIYMKKLPVNIYIPVSFLEFGSDKIAITDTISIIRMDNGFQTSRFLANRFNSAQESAAAQCAGFAIMISGCSLRNEENLSLSDAFSDYAQYPSQIETIINDLFAVIRIVQNAETDYGQLLIEPDGWAEEWITDLPPLYEVKIKTYKESTKIVDFLRYNIVSINDESIDLIKKLYLEIQRQREEATFRKVVIALQRLNRCMLRNSDDDIALDAIIGIETLLSGDTRGEITYTISNRISVIAAKLSACPYTPSEARLALKKIYAFRSDIVHGRDLAKNRIIKINGQELETKKLAVEFLRYSLLFLLCNPQYLEVRQFEIALDASLSDKEN